MSNVIKFPVRNARLEEIMEVMDVAYNKMASVNTELSTLEDTTHDLQHLFDSEIKALAHRLGGMGNVPVDYLLYTTLDSEIIDLVQKQMGDQWKTTS